MDIRRGKTSSINNCIARTFSVYSGFALGLKNLEKLQNSWKIRKKIVIYNKILENVWNLTPDFRLPAFGLEQCSTFWIATID